MLAFQATLQTPQKHETDRYACWPQLPSFAGLLTPYDEHAEYVLVRGRSGVLYVGQPSNSIARDEVPASERECTLPKLRTEL